MPSFLTWPTSSGMRLAPSRREYSLWVWRWTNAMHRNGQGGRILAPGAEPALTAFEINVLIGPVSASNVSPP